jgi:large subunit ribosomal protein L23
MGLFSRKKSSLIKATEDKKEKKDEKVDKKSTKVSDIKKEEKEDIKKKRGEKKQSMRELYGESQVSSAPVKAGKKEKKKRKYGNAYKVLLKPLVTEKAANLGAGNKYVFAVSSKSNKIEIAKAVNEVYGIKPLGVNIIKMGGKKVRYGRLTGKRKDWKKAIVTLPKGESIKVYEGV